MNWNEIKALYEKAGECLWNIKKASCWSIDYENGYYYLFAALREARLRTEKNLEQLYEIPHFRQMGWRVILTGRPLEVVEQASAGFIWGRSGIDEAEYHEIHRPRRCGVRVRNDWPFRTSWSG